MSVQGGKNTGGLACCVDSPYSSIHTGRLANKFGDGYLSMSDMSMPAFRPPGFLWKNATQTCCGAVRLPPPSSRLGLGLGLGSGSHWSVPACNVGIDHNHPVTKFVVYGTRPALFQDEPS